MICCPEDGKAQVKIILVQETSLSTNPGFTEPSAKSYESLYPCTKPAAIVPFLRDTVIDDVVSENFSQEEY